MSWRHFLLGLLSNLQEAHLGRSGWPELCPVLWSIPGGFLLVMAAAEICSDENPPSSDLVQGLTSHPERRIPVEAKADSFGLLDGRLVATDYGLQPTALL